MGMNPWEWEGMGMLQAIPAHLYPVPSLYSTILCASGMR